MTRRDAARHGSVTMYRNYKCRCFPCRIAESRYNELWRAGGTRRVPRELVAAHLELLLDSGWRREDIRAAIECSGSTVWNLMEGKTQAVNSRLAGKILALQPRPSLREHLRELIRSGWTVETLAAETGLHVETVVRARRGRGRPYRRTFGLLMAVEPLGRAVMLPAEPLVRHLRPRLAARGMSVKSLGDRDRRQWHRMCEPGYRVNESTADAWAVRFGLLLEEVYGPDYDSEVAA